MLPDFRQHGAHLGEVTDAKNDEWEWASGSVYRVCPVVLTDALQGLDRAGCRKVAMVRKINLETISWLHGAGLSPPLVDLVEVTPIKHIVGNRLAEEGKLLENSMGPL